MHLYIVRHGESKQILDDRIQDDFDELTEKGKQQVEVLARKLRKIKIDYILSSSQKRSFQTAQIINSVLNLPLEFTDLLKEKKLPGEIQGKKKNNKQVRKVINLLTENFPKEKWRYQDEETFADLKKRAARLFRYVVGLKKEGILLVTHAHFLKMIIAFMIYKNDLTARDYLEVDRFFKTANAGITICHLDKRKKWRLETWSDHCYLS